MGKRRILVTGSNGLLGQKIVYALKSREDTELIATSVGENRLISKAGYVYRNLDVTRAGEVMEVLSEYKPDSVIHTAAMTNVDACETEKESCLKLNVEAVRHLSEACAAHDIHLVHLSTDFVFDGKSGPYREEDIPNPLSFYGRSKLEAEKILQSSSIRWAILRTIIIYGIADNMSRSNVVLWAKGALEKGQQINVVDDQFRSPTLAEDLAEACISASLKQAQGVFHVSGREIMSIFDLVQKVAGFFGLDKSLIRPVKSADLKQPAMRPPYTGFIIDKAESELDFHPHSFSEGLGILGRQLKAIQKV
jgi:dTDP-4-dehydrorhamnose reductase